MPTTMLDEVTLHHHRGKDMCRSIKTLFNFEPPATDEEIRAASVQFVRKLSGFNSPSKLNAMAFDRAVDEVTVAARALIASLVTNAEPRDREVEAVRARARGAARFSTQR
jgi:hypothetical protein